MAKWIVIAFVTGYAMCYLQAWVTLSEIREEMEVLND